MPSPFPGMDPYLEDPSIWPGFHTRLIDSICDVLNEALPEQYVADVNERVYVETKDRPIGPDVAVVRRQDDREVRGGLLLADPPTVLVEVESECRETFVEVFTSRPERLVATIEVLSPTNKRPGSDGRDKYLQKQAQLLQSDVHLLEIDLLRSGAHSVAAGPGTVAVLGTIDYLVLLHRAGTRRRFDSWGIRLRDRLPNVDVPLAEGDEDAVLALQRAFDRAYDKRTFRRPLDYTVEPAVPLSPDDAAWADSLLREKGLRP